LYSTRCAPPASGISITPGLGFTSTRAGFGGFPLGFAAILVFCLFSQQRIRPALAAIATVVAIVVAVRLYGVAQDGTLRQSVHLLIPETVIMIVALLGVLLEQKRRVQA